MSRMIVLGPKLLKQAHTTPAFTNLVNDLCLRHNKDKCQLAVTKVLTPADLCREVHTPADLCSEVYIPADLCREVYTPADICRDVNTHQQIYAEMCILTSRPKYGQRCFVDLC